MKRMQKFSAGDGISMGRYKAAIINVSFHICSVMLPFQVCPYKSNTGYFLQTMKLGLGDVIDRNIPAQVIIDGCVPKNVACGWWHTLLLAELPT